MNKHFSLFLDLVRFTAAILVVLSHFGNHNIGLPAAMPDFGREAVVVFFLLSGYVIAYTTSEKSMSLREYVVARCARIYSVAIPVVLLCFFLAYVASQFSAGHINSSYQLQKPYVYLPLHFLFMGELWNLAEVPPWLIQYWSLGYEVWYYVLFGVAFYLRGAKRLLLGAVVLLIMGFKLWLLLPVWLAGAYLYKYQKDLPLTALQARLAWLATLALLLAFKLYGVDHYLRALGTALWPFAGLHLGSADRFLADYVVAALIYLNFVLARQAGFSSLQVLATPIRALAAYTFTLYLIHGPVMGLWQLFYPHNPNSLADILLLSAAIGLATYTVGLVSEQRKRAFHDGFNAVYLACTRRFA